MNAKQKTVLVVGASRGLGLGLATELARRGWRVIATARQPAQAEALQALAARSDGNVEIERLDVDEPAHLEALAGRLAGRPLDLLVVNAGISGTPQSVAQATREDLARVMWTNALAPVRIAERLLPQVVDGGRVAFMSSLLGSIASNESGGYDLYRISKASLNMLARSFAMTAAKDRQITVLNLHPGWVRTDMGGPAAPLDVETSVSGLADVLEAPQAQKHCFVDYQGKPLPW